MRIRPSLLLPPVLQGASGEISVAGIDLHRPFKHAHEILVSQVPRALLILN